MSRTSCLCICSRAASAAGSSPPAAPRPFSTSATSQGRYKAVKDSNNAQLRWRMPPRVRMAPATPREFETTITHSNGAVITLHTTSPRAHQPLTRDTYNSGLWSFASSVDPSAIAEKDESGRLSRFAKRQTLADRATQSPLETTESVHLREQQLATAQPIDQVKQHPAEEQKQQQQQQQYQQQTGTEEFDFAELLDVGGELQAVDQKQIARPDRSGKKKKGKK